MFARSRMRHSTIELTVSPRTPQRGAANSGLPRNSEAAPAGQLSSAGLLWSAPEAAGPTEPFLTSGLYVAATAWIRALAEHGTIAQIDVLSNFWDVESCRAQLGGVPSREGAGGPPAVLPEFALPARLQEGAYDVLHDPANLDFTCPSYARSRFCNRLFPITASQHGISASGQLYTCFLKMLTAQIYPCDAIVCLTPSARQAMQNRLASIAERYCRAWEAPAPVLPRLEIIPWGIDAKRFTPRDPAPARRELDLPLGRPIVLCVGRLRIHDKMDWTPLLLAIQRVIKTVREPPLLVLAGANSAGYGERILSQAAEMGLSGSVRAFFNLPHACLPALYAASDIFVSPVDTLSESFGLTIIEAMASGRPVVASDWNGYKDLVVHGETGFKVPTHWADCLGELNQLAPFLTWEHEHLHVGQSVSVDVGQMAGYLVRLLENREQREEMGRRGRARVEALYDWRVVIPQWVALWTELGAVARSIDRKEPDRLDFVRPDHFQQFSHYASRIVADNTPVKLTARGQQLIARQAPLFLHPWSQGFLRPELLRATLLALKPTGWLDAGLPAGELVRVLHKTHGLSRDQAMMHLMWLAKYDLVSLAGGEE